MTESKVMRVYKMVKITILISRTSLVYFKWWWKWVNTHKNQTIQLVGPVLKQYALVATRASEARFPGPKSSLWGSVSACLVAGFHVDLEFLRLGLLKVKPSLRNSSFKVLSPVMSGWMCACVPVWSYHRWLCACVDESEGIWPQLALNMFVSDVVNQFREYILIAQATKTCFKPCEPILSV